MVKILSQIRAKLFRVIVLVLIFTFTYSGSPFPASAETDFLGDPCHLAITVVNGTRNYDLSAVGVSSYIDWGVTRSSDVASNIEHVKVLRVGDTAYQNQLTLIDNIVPLNLGQVWLIGNEPDTWHGGQDFLTAEVYAQRFIEMTENIKGIDPTARVGFGQIVQPSPLRIRYMRRMWASLVSLTGSESNALNLIDIFSIHAFILNEQPGPIWGAGIPPGFGTDYADAFIIDGSDPADMTKTYSETIFSGWVTNFRQWMDEIGAQNKPLWITEYGSLMPPLDPPGLDYYNVSEADTTAYMLETFAFIYNTKDPLIGYPSDDNRLVQRAYWYSLNDFRWNFGGALFDPVTHTRTLVGDGFVEYDPPVPPVNPEIYPVSVTFVPLRFTSGSGMTHVDYRVDVRVGNNVTAENRVPVTANLTIDGVPMSPQSGMIARCGGVGIFSFLWPNKPPLQDVNVHAAVSIASGSSLVDTNLSNNSLDVVVTPDLPKTVFLPFATR